MSFVSYAQNFEDVMLWRALKHVENGFYVDVGAQDPVVDSVSLAFYEHGWRGVHVEPTRQYSDKLRMARPDETVLQVAIGNQAGTLSFYEFEDTGLSTADPDIAHRHKDAGFLYKETLVSVISLDALFERIGDRDIHWLKLDVEGLEKAVLESWKGKVLPWVLVIESTRPLTQEENYQEWEQLILSKGYRFAYFDGLNRFYVSPNHVALAKAFSSPPNFFDGFVLSASQPFCKEVEGKAQQAETKAQQAETKAQQAETKAQQAEACAQQTEIRAQQAEARAQQTADDAAAWRQQAERWLAQSEVRAQQTEIRAQQAEARAQQTADDAAAWRQQAERWHEQINALYNSTSWRVTKPLRGVKRLLVGDLSPVRQAGVAAVVRTKQVLRPLIATGIRQVFDRPALREKSSRVLKKFPWLHRRLLRVAMNTGVVPTTIDNVEQRQSMSAIKPSQPVNKAMTPLACQVYSDLKTAIEAKNTGGVSCV